jgi:hypothetical protein
MLTCLNNTVTQRVTKSCFHVSVSSSSARSEHVWLSVSVRLYTRMVLLRKYTESFSMKFGIEGSALH